MIIGIPREIQEHELRVSATPETIKKLIKLNHSVLVEKDAGSGSFISNDGYKNSGAKIVDSSDEIHSQSDIILKVNPPKKIELEKIKDRISIISFFQIKDEVELLNQYISKQITYLSMSHIPRTTLAQKMDALSSQSNIAGYKSVIIGADLISSYMPLLMTAAGTIQPAKILILGAGVAGLSAIATAKRLGAQVFAFDVRTAVKEQVESLGAKFIEVKTDTDEGTGEGGYAKEVSEEYKKKQFALIEDEIKKMDLVITTALIPERPAPILITSKMVESMKKGSVIMDLAAINGGNCELTQVDKTINHNGIQINGSSNIVSSMSIHASQLYSKNIYNFFEHIYNKENSFLNIEDEITKGSMLFEQGVVKNDNINKFLNTEDIK